MDVIVAADPHTHIIRQIRWFLIMEQQLREGDQCARLIAEMINFLAEPLGLEFMRVHPNFRITVVQKITEFVKNKLFRELTGDAVTKIILS